MTLPVVLVQNHIAVRQLSLFSFEKSKNALHFFGDGKPVPYGRIANLHSLNNNLSGKGYYKTVDLGKKIKKKLLTWLHFWVIIP